MQKEESKTIAGVENSPYYQGNDRLECIEEMRLMFGDEAVKTFCRLNAYKYYYRAGYKTFESAAKDRAKALWYLNFAKMCGEKEHDPFNDYTGCEY